MILDDIVKYKKMQLEEQKKLKPIDMLIEQCAKIDTSDFNGALSKKGISIIAEIKKASPSKGVIKKNFNPVKIAEIYDKIGVDAISVLTERHFFKGKDEYINDVKTITTKPVLRKDFIIEEYQIYESKVLGADAILLIVSIVGNHLKDLYGTAKGIGLDCLVEVHDRKELDIALDARCEIIGINNRDLKSFEVDLSTTENLIKYIPEYKTIVSESGIKSASDIKYLKSLGVDAVLIGETFMRIVEDFGEINDFIHEAKR